MREHLSQSGGKGTEGKLGPKVYDIFLREGNRQGRVGMLGKLSFGAFAHFPGSGLFGWFLGVRYPALG